jgi:hypothetical protein
VVGLGAEVVGVVVEARAVEGDIVNADDVPVYGTVGQTVTALMLHATELSGEPKQEHDSLVNDTKPIKSKELLSTKIYTLKLKV